MLGVINLCSCDDSGCCCQVFAIQGEMFWLLYFWGYAGGIGGRTQAVIVCLQAGLGPNPVDPTQLHQSQHGGFLLPQ